MPVTVVLRTLSQAPVVLARMIRRWSVTIRYPTKYLSVVSFASFRFSACYTFLLWAPECSILWRMLLPPPRPELDPRLLAEILGTYIILPSLDSGVPVRISWPVSYLDILWWVRGVVSSLRKDEVKRFPGSSFPLLKTFPSYPRWPVVENPLWLDRAYHYSVTFLGIFPCGFSDSETFLLPRLYMLFQPIIFGLSSPDIPAQKTRARAHLKYMVSRQTVFWLQDYLDAQSECFVNVWDNKLIPIHVFRIN